MTGYTFTACFSDIAERVNECSQLGDIRRSDFFGVFDEPSRFSSCDDVEATVKTFFRSNKFLGTERSDIRIGHLTRWSDLEWDVSRHFSGGVLNLGEYRTAALVGDQVKIAELLALIEELPISAFVVWGFLNGSEPFQSLDMSLLPCVLGLEILDPHEYLPVVIEVPHGESTFIPSAFDGAFNPYWCAGGKTCPRNECASEEGLEEVIVKGPRSDGGWAKFEHARPART